MKRIVMLLAALLLAPFAVRRAAAEASPKPNNIFLKGGKRELYNLQTDLSETRDVAGANPVVVARLAALMSRIIDEGRSTAGEPQKNADGLSWTILPPAPDVESGFNTAAQQREEDKP